MKQTKHTQQNYIMHLIIKNLQKDCFMRCQAKSNAINNAVQKSFKQYCTYIKRGEENEEYLKHACRNNKR